MYKIRCSKCNHVRTLSQKWIVENVPNEIRKHYILEWLGGRLVCEKCNSKNSIIKKAAKRNKKIDYLIKKESNWLYSNEMEILLRMKKLLKNGHLLSKKQRQLLDEICSRIQDRRSIKAIFFQGGSPGSGK